MARKNTEAENDKQEQTIIKTNTDL